MSLEHEERTGKMIGAAIYENALAIEWCVQGVPFIHGMILNFSKPTLKVKRVTKRRGHRNDSAVGFPGFLAS